MVEPPPTRPEDGVRAIAGAARTANRVVAELTLGRADLRTLVPAVLAGAALVQLFRRPVPARWDNLLWWSYSTLMTLNSERFSKSPGA